MGVTERLRMRRTERWLLILAALVLLVARSSLALASGDDPAAALIPVAQFALVFLAVHLVLCWLLPYADCVMLPVVALLNGLGILMIHRLDPLLITQRDGSVTEVFLAPGQLQWTVVALVVMIAVLLVIRNHRVFTRYSYLLGILGLILLALPMVWPGSGSSDAKIWISLGPFSVQPGEFSKILLLLFFAQLLVNKRARLNVAGARILGLDFPRLRDLGPILLVWAVALVIMAGENDFGPALLLFSTVLGMLYLATGRTSWLLIGGMLVAVGGYGVYTISAKIQSRVHNFIDPLANYDGTGYQLSQALFGMSWGGITGTGLGQGYPDEVPVAHTDFILAAIGEELGLVGLTAVLILFAILIIRGMRTAILVRDSYGKLVAAGLSLTLAIQVFVVTAGISALMPMTGLTTPFISHGGSSLMANYILVALLLRISDTARRPVVRATGPTATPVPDLRQEVRR
ncbi:FtsW/RodA/SpoVE family cell cycle protein [Corynebacterium pygosceleis]|uniref:FtsW/RodA/SpoVE family cell cycle protein n=1 Tax=Corynebacterium pygosceleis TaxID=2800406 RepID=A0A9Q4C826_9CORY|nr:FtsW/RodA/SpoVE family cell cycle protein [Corynebacterium pygosceleis]MCK7637235.1 FtsW/RodA/SpoVE family cell cycle protein [Corynebacterium pygosceleis]MCK7676172.1 FtsW/RodA/SpoVE family cell cycle protein [Corynebacterium pygosceleis]MCL0119990.1 FtsW/RodA/SpoVE family cell cycle protein [Corynebacterium pygosceleis]MCX7445138.1 FtsW/RodA/SpoVE family cell cycle protein [Corynebacterium pygosceleis]MCX7468437.1 FtsW/RodA/SpoVE family cell cycle protein [Corynebacterium pygosceleis]